MRTMFRVSYLDVLYKYEMYIICSFAKPYVSLTSNGNQTASDGRSDPNLCRPSAMDFIGDLINSVGDIIEENSPSEPAPVPTPEPNPGSGRKLGAAAAGVLRAILGRLF